MALGFLLDSQTSTQTQPAQTQTEEMDNSEKEMITDKSKESSAAS